jgi:methanogenic corrinoid protein MtbC1
VYLHVFQPAQYEIGRLWQTNRITVAMEHYCSAATQLIMSQLYPHVFATAKNGRTLIATCVSGDLHEIGVRMVADFFELAGWSTFYLGANTPDGSVIATVVERRSEVLAVSATLSCHVAAVRTLIRAVRLDPAAAGVKVLVGGYPFNQDPQLWRTVGADGWAPDAREAVSFAWQLLPAAGA